jgi:hypothetical protein
MAAERAEALWAMDHAAALRGILSGDAPRWRLLGLVRSLGLPDCWVGAGFIRDTVWDRLHGRPASPLRGDVDVVWFDPARAETAEDRRLEELLRGLDPSVGWSVKNQARMHRRNGDPPYGSAADAMRHWPETATAVAARRGEADRCEVAAPFGLEDLFALVLRPTPKFAGERHGTFLERVRVKGWLLAWPLLRVEEA